MAYSWIAAGTVPFTRNALLIVLAPGLILGAIAYGRPPERIPPPDRMDVAGFSYWAVCVVALFEWEAFAFRDNALWWHPSLTELIDPMLGAPGQGDGHLDMAAQWVGIGAEVTGG